MSKYRITREDPKNYNKLIKEFWNRYLPGTPDSRFEWLIDNPDGPVIWLFAIDNSSDEVVGMISILPKKLTYGDNVLVAGILGDYMVHEKHRLFGPAMDLMKNAVNILKQGEFDFLYTIPNISSKKIIERLGFSYTIDLCCLVSPQSLGFVIEKYFSKKLPLFIERSLLFIVDLFSIDRYSRFKGSIEEINWSDELIDTLPSTLKKIESRNLLGGYELSYLKWRYIYNPNYNFRLFVLKNIDKTKILGFFSIAIDNQRLELYDIHCVDDNATYAALRKVKEICREHECRGVYYIINKKSYFLNIIKKCNFFDTKESFEVYSIDNGINSEIINNWIFTSSDRNI